MQRLSKTTLAVIFIFLLSCNTGPGSSTEKDKQLITEMSKARAKAFIEGDAAAIAKHFTDDAFLMAPGRPAATGRAAVQTYYESIFSEYTTQLESH
ncbi:MAG TPA: DUF4440 domain-containing protein, partial [Chitinophagaceae bacterium]|nr:DUF4440 domain-containing protein [Chitinophagaceae bacterium]